MPTLSELQQGFAEAILTAGETGPALTCAEEPRGAARMGPRNAERMAVHSRSIASNYRAAMSASYAAVQRIVGVSSFHAAVDAYVEAHPSRSGDLNEYGDAFGDFLARYPPAEELPYLPDVARLEWAVDEANRAADSRCAPDAVLGALSSLAAEELPRLCLRLDPSCRLVASAFPLLRIRQVNQPDYRGDLKVDFAAGPDQLRIRREPETTKGVVIECLPAGHFAWLSALSELATLAEAIEQARNVDPSFDLQAALHAYIGDGTVAGVCARPLAGIGECATIGNGEYTTTGIGDPG